MTTTTQTEITAINLDDPDWSYLLTWELTRRFGEVRLHATTMPGVLVVEFQPGRVLTDPDILHVADVVAAMQAANRNFEPAVTR